MSKTIEWSISMEELFRRPPDLTIQCPEWLAEWMEWQDELDASKMLPRVPMDPTGPYLGSKPKEKVRTVGMVFADLLKANGWKEADAGPEIGISRDATRRLLKSGTPTLRL